MNNHTKSSSPKDIDLSKHGIIEAHAGTGKTYTIVKLVLRMLEKPSGDNNEFIHLRDILLVTYTEKAAGELKERIRNGIAERIRELDESDKSSGSNGNECLTRHLGNCLNIMHEALIGTIHSVCLRILQTWPFETGAHFNTQITDDNEGVDALLRVSMRTDWLDESAGIPAALKVLESLGVKLTNKTELGLIRKTALACLAGDGRKIDDSLSGGMSIEETIDERNRLGVELKESLNPLLEEYCGALTELYNSGRLDDKRQKFIETVISRTNAMINTGIYNIKYVEKPKKIGSSSIYTKTEAKKIQEYALRIDELEEQITEPHCIELVKRHSATQSQLLYAMIYRAAEKLSERYDAYKRENGLVSYNDMLRLMHHAVRTENSAVLKGLRQRLRYGIIDEFQDTSVIQWEIFEKIFLDGNDSARVYIVGDPKQSIYSFQNADIRSYVAAKKAIKAANEAITNKSGDDVSLYPLINNYRSLPEMIAGYNAILKPKDTEECGSGRDWFLYDSGEISYPNDEAAQPPEERKEAPEHPLTHGAAVQVVLSDDKDIDEDDGADVDDESKNQATPTDDGQNVKSGNGKMSMAAAACAAIKKLVGTQISLPKGNGWENLTLDYSDFAVIVETHALANPFIDEFREQRIPYMKYKMAGVFRSQMARDLIAVLTAVNRRYSRAPKTAALLTHFFNRPPAAISPDRDLQECAERGCSGDNLCVAHAVAHWGKLADRQLWAQLFSSIIERTGVRERLIRLIDGERKFADLRQVTDYCVEYLHRQNSSLKQLIDHLERLCEEKEDAGQDRNLHTLSTEKSSVKILTMHAAKGLEFPVVFLMNKDKPRNISGPDTILWTDDDATKRFTPFLSKNDLTLDESSAKQQPSSTDSQTNDRIDESKDNITPLQSYIEDQRRERRRLLYVAMTRPKAMLFVPMREADEVLSPHLQWLLDNKDPNVEIFDADRFGAACGKSIKNGDDGAEATPLDDLPEQLPLQNFISRETSFSQLSKEIKRRKQDKGDGFTANLIDGGDDTPRGDEYHAEDEVDTDYIGTGDGTNPRPPENRDLPGGSQTGDALHNAIEELLKADDIRAILDDGGALDKIITKHLQSGGVLDNLPTKGKDPETARRAAVGRAAAMVKSALTTPFPIPDGGTVTIADIPKPDRLPEIEFLMSCAPTQHRIRGFIDLVFRLRNDSHRGHPYCYYFVDWKSNTLESYANDAVRQYCIDQNYSLQAEIYARALDKYLNGILGDRYSRDENLGASLFIFLREAGAHYSEKLKNFPFDDADIYIHM